MVVSRLAVLVGLMALGVVSAQLTTNSTNRSGKVFSLFNLVRFANDPCQSTSKSSGSGFRNGTCHTSSDCSSRGGRAAGSCAAGFGVCCVFVASATGSVVSNNCTYLQNPGYPNSYTDSADITYTVQKVQSSICRLRLDFDSFTILAFTASVETGPLAVDTFAVTVTSTTQSIPTISGSNSGQHMYVDVGSDSSSAATLEFKFNVAQANSVNRAWDIKVSQFDCSSRDLPPDGCLQYHTGLTGRMTSFNFVPSSSNNFHLPNQRYSTCIRQESGFCCVQFQVCSDQPNGFTLDNPDSTIFTSLNDASCDTRDYITIPGSSGQCGGVNLHSRYCGNVLNSISVMTGALHAPICDCSPPFLVSIYTDAMAEDITDPVSPSVGICLEWFQTPCAV